MSTSQDADPLQSAEVEFEEQIERRRSGRPGVVNPNLIQLLRDPASDQDIASDLVITPKAALGASKGIMIGLFFVAPIWVTLAIAVYYIF